MDIWVLGGGRFGTRAATRLAGANRAVLVVDREPAGLAAARDLGVDTRQADAVAFLRGSLGEGRRPDWIVPAVPFHLAAAWCLAELGPGLVRHPIPPEVERAVPNPFRAAEDEIYASHATWRCPPDCPEPADRCTVTGEPRPKDLFRLLAELDVPPFRPFVLRSHQLAPGVGGYRPEELLSLRDALGAHLGPALVATACRCHGVITGVLREG
ncbi:NAD-binding protein [Deferrisoma palaeochoriense]